MINFYKTLVNSILKDEKKNNNKISINGKTDKSNKTKCPKCNCEKVIKFGFFKGAQRYKCNNEGCGKTFIEDKDNPFRCSKKFKENYQDYFKLFIQGKSIRECASKMNITITTSFFWRHRFLADFCNENYIEKIDSYVELSKMIILENFKGDKKYHGEERDKIVVVTAINDRIDVLPIIAGRRFLDFYEIRNNLIPRIDNKAYIVGFQDSRLKTFAKALNEIRKVKLKYNCDFKIDLAYSIKVKAWLKKFNGVASKYLDHYLNWRAFEYKNNIIHEERNNFSLRKINSQLNITAEINTYISWSNVKKKVISV
ncbi:IS1 family transposase [Clostridium sp. 1001271B_151109_B4]|uniref:IS1 family transposase n=1 Tax=Clostridium sp. 1001271B_151109_B4 TaxID=2787148 RepID=UPI0018AB2603|nr:IS1 family transposase [Clostridium sp. 1001271B_151109_B4]